MRSLRRRPETCPEQHLAHGRRRNGDAEPLELARGSERLNATSSARSARVSRGLEACRRRIASSWRRRRISNSFERRGRPSSHTSANRFRTTRYTNDQSKQPSLDHGTSAEASEPNASKRRGRVCEPYGQVWSPLWSLQVENARGGARSP